MNLTKKQISALRTLVEMFGDDLVDNGKLTEDERDDLERELIDEEDRQ